MSQRNKKLFKHFKEDAHFLITKGLLTPEEDLWLEVEPCHPHKHNILSTNVHILEGEGRMQRKFLPKSLVFAIELGLNHDKEGKE